MLPNVFYPFLSLSLSFAGFGTALLHLARLAQSVRGIFHLSSRAGHEEPYRGSILQCHWQLATVRGAFRTKAYNRNRLLILRMESYRIVLLIKKSGRNAPLAFECVFTGRAAVQMSCHIIKVISRSSHHYGGSRILLKRDCRWLHRNNEIGQLKDLWPHANRNNQSRALDVIANWCPGWFINLIGLFNLHLLTISRFPRRCRGKKKSAYKNKCYRSAIHYNRIVIELTHLKHIKGVPLECGHTIWYKRDRNICLLLNHIPLFSIIERIRACSDLKSIK